MWLVGVVIRRYIDILIIIINFPYSTCIRSFLAAASLLLCSFLNVFSVLESTDSMILNLILLQWTYRDSVLSSDARLNM